MCRLQLLVELRARHAEPPRRRRSSRRRWHRAHRGSPRRSASARQVARSPPAAEATPAATDAWRQAPGGLPPASSTSLGARAAARSSTLRNSRTLPGQSWACSSRIASGMSTQPRWSRRPHGLLEQGLAEHRDVLAPLAQRRDANGQHRDAIVEVGAEALVGELGLEVLRRRGDDAHIDLVAPCWSPAPRSRPPAARAGTWPGWPGGMSPISSRNSVPPWASSNLPWRALLVGAGIGAGRHAEELGLEQLLGHGGNVDGHEGPVGAVGLLVDGMGQQFLARYRSRPGSAPHLRAGRSGAPATSVP